MRKLLTKILFRLLDKKESYQDINEKRISNWLWRQYTSPGFREYFRKRDLQLLKTMGIGLKRDDYLIYLGQRLELMRLLEQVNKAYQEYLKKKQKKVGEKKQKK